MHKQINKMGAASSVIREGITINDKYLDLNGTIYKQLKCGCIYCSHYEYLQPLDIELALPCYDCFEGLREKDYEKFNIKNVQNGCGFCSGHFVDVETALKVMQSANLLPLVPYTKSHIKWKSKCLICERVVFPTYNSIQQGNGGCKYCSK